MSQEQSSKLATSLPKPTDHSTEETGLRYLGYLGRIRNFVRAGSRYLAYTSDVGEAFRPVVRPYIVTAAYGVSFAYVGLDVANEGYKSSQRGDDSSIIARTVIQRSIFQGLASLYLPAITIHSVVHYTARAVKSHIASGRAWMRFAPTAAGLVVVPFLPIMYDHPLEGATEWIFDRIWPVREHHSNEKRPGE